MAWRASKTPLKWGNARQSGGIVTLLSQGLDRGAIPSSVGGDEPGRCLGDFGPDSQAGGGDDGRSLRCHGNMVAEQVAAMAELAGLAAMP
jgi:hypothetical protein